MSNNYFSRGINLSVFVNLLFPTVCSNAYLSVSSPVYPISLVYSHVNPSHLSPTSQVVVEIKKSSFDAKSIYSTVNDHIRLSYNLQSKLDRYLVRSSPLYESWSGFRSVAMTVSTSSCVQGTWARDPSRAKAKREWQKFFINSKILTIASEDDSCQTIVLEKSMKGDDREKSRSQSSTFWHIQEKQGCHFLMRKLWVSIERLGLPMKLIR